MERRRAIVYVAGGAAALPVLWFAWSWITYPSDHTPKGAYLRVMSGVNRGEPAAFFPYIETAAQHACYTIQEYRKKARQRVLRSYPEPERSRLAREYKAEAQAADGPAIFAMQAKQRGWLARLRRDMSGVKKVEVNGERATVETVRGTRYPFRRRENGIWGLTLFTATLVSEAEKAARDYRMVKKAADDYDRVKAARPASSQDPPHRDAQ